MSKLAPKNRMEAYAHQLRDDADLLMRLALAEDKNGYDQALVRIQMMIHAYHSKRLIAKSEKVQKKNKENEAFLKQYFRKR